MNIWFNISKRSHLSRIPSSRVSAKVESVINFLREIEREGRGHGYDGKEHQEFKQIILPLHHLFVPLNREQFQ